MSAYRSEWFKSSYSAQNGECIETRRAASEGVDVRDSKSPLGPVLNFSDGAWVDFVAEVKGDRSPEL
ncbi:DUF397 domain-containing protein [Streptomyces sp. NBC_01136]|uniref:DUF397 domain-containing protein n=1 Tax=unclassified Streptomyces TaxID=2593676 RepID=UPI003255B7DA|nr:DUF397 domain-containing protein [Streptomyces sp. NBC_01136]